MIKTTEQRSDVASTWSWTFQTLGVLLGTATCISIVKNVGAIELFGLPARAFAQYAWLRDMLFEPIAWPLRYLGLSLPWLLKDLLLGYLLIGAAFYRGALVFWRGPNQKYFVKPKMVIEWPVWIYDWIVEIRTQTASIERMRATDPEFAEDRAGSLRRMKRLLWLFLLNVVVILVATAAFFIWNSLGSSAGPS
jgi:hypothetical protein